MAMKNASKALTIGRAFSTSATLQQAVPAVAQPKSKGFLASIFGGGDRVMVPLSEPLPDIEVPKHVDASVQAPKTNITTLSNGFRVASEDTLGATSTLGLFVDSGSVRENPSNTGVSHLLEYLAFKTTNHRTHLRLVRETEVIGANTLASASREQMVYSIDTTKATVPEALEILTDAVLNPKFASWEVAEARTKMEADLKNVAENPQTMLLEAAHTVGYTGALAKPLISPADSVATLTADTVAEFFATNYTAPRMVLAAAGVQHDQLVKLAEPLLSSAPAAAAATPEPASEYVGGDFRQTKANSPLTHAILAFEYKGGWRDVKGSVAMTVMQYLMGGGGSFSAGGPGKGMHSRLYTRVLNKYGWVQNATALSSIYNNTGLVGIFASADSRQAGSLVDVMCHEMLEVGRASSLTSEELERAKAAATSSIMMNLESRAIIAEDIGRQILTYGKRVPVEEILKEIQGLKVADITKAAAALFKSPVTLVTHGDVSGIPRYDIVSKRFA